MIISPLNLHMIPRIGTVLVADISQHHRISTLAPVWHSKASTTEKSFNVLAFRQFTPQLWDWKLI
ncbi:MAG: hypothetical protein ABJD75_00100 [Parasphingorhabdus sp.]|uniref:hypothetical protein n=2 Tax=Parasphingorhabdus sp. TaxID=2709688 RepID=UPI003267F304